MRWWHFTSKRSKVSFTVRSLCSDLYAEGNVKSHSPFSHFPSQVPEHPNGQRFRQLQPEHGVLWALDHPVPTLHHLPLQEEAKEPPRRPQPPGGQLAPLLHLTKRCRHSQLLCTRAVRCQALRQWNSMRRCATKPTTAWLMTTDWVTAAKWPVGQSGRALPSCSAPRRRRGTDRAVSDLAVGEESEGLGEGGRSAALTKIQGRFACGKLLWFSEAPFPRP